MAVVTARQLLDAGVHFGHQTRRWNPKMKRFIFTDRNGIYIIDLHKSIKEIETAYHFVRDLVASGGQILFVGTKKQAQEGIAEQAMRVGMPYVNQRWLGGMLTNFPTMMKRIQRMKELEAMDLSENSTLPFTKKEILGLARERDKLARSLGGIRDMGKAPNAVWVVDTNKEHLAVKEARKLGIPVVAILDTNCDPDEVDYGIPGNDDAIRAVALLTKVIADGVADGLMARSQAPKTGTEQEVELEPMPEWERELLAGGDSTGADQASEAQPSVVETAVEEPAVETPAVEEPALEVPVESAGVEDTDVKAETTPKAKAEAKAEPKAETEASPTPKAKAETKKPATKTTTPAKAAPKKTTKAAEESPTEVLSDAVEALVEKAEETLKEASDVVSDVVDDATSSMTEAVNEAVEATGSQEK